MPLEAPRYDLTPAGLHYLLIHYDIPEISAPGWWRRLGRLFREPRELDPAQLREFEETTVRVTLECAEQDYQHSLTLGMCWWPSRVDVVRRP
jgi:hypothetical protein